MWTRLVPHRPERSVTDRGGPHRPFSLIVTRALAGRGGMPEQACARAVCPSAAGPHTKGRPVDDRASCAWQWLLREGAGLQALGVQVRLGGVAADRRLD